jgi:hypothetical protein
VIGPNDDLTANHGRYVAIGACGSNRPSSHSCIRAIALNDFEIDPIANGESAAMGFFVLRSA